MDARMGQVYWAAYDCGGEVPAAVGDEHLTDPDGVEPPEGRWFGAGHGFGAYPGLVVRLQSRLTGTDAGLLPRAADIARIAAIDYQSGKGVPAIRALPVYLRNEVVHRR
jgi:tRNA threonylcarbamoyladenosine biosynthesis protein TsaB